MNLFRIILFSFLFVFEKNSSETLDPCSIDKIHGNVRSCIGRLVDIIWKLHQWSQDTQIDICGMTCFASTKGRISKWQWKWDGRFRCPSKVAGIIGRSTKASRKGAMQWAVQDFVDKAIHSDQIQPEDLLCSLYENTTTISY